MKWMHLMLCCVLAASACDGDPEIREVHVAHYLTSCVGVGTRLCTIVDNELFYSGIAGWTFAWGHEYDLLVEIEDVKNPLEDGSSSKYTLVEVLADHRVAEGTNFTIPIFDNYLISEGTNTTYSIMDERDFDCSANGLCGDIAAALENSNPCIELELSHPADDASPLVVESVARLVDWDC